MRMHKKRMQTILRVKTHLEKKAQQELKVIREAKERENRLLNEMQVEHRTTAQETGKVSKTRASAMAFRRAFLQKLSKDIQAQESKIGEISVQEGSKREELIARSQSKQMVEQLNDKQRSEEQKERDKKEQTAIDVLALRSKGRLRK
jgi:flagellar export protein FliJ